MLITLISILNTNHLLLVCLDDYLYVWFDILDSRQSLLTVWMVGIETHIPSKCWLGYMNVFKPCFVHVLNTCRKDKLL